MKTPFYSTLSSLAVLTATAMFLSTACPALGEASNSPNNPDKICKYKKKCSSCGKEGCNQDSNSEDETKEIKVGHGKSCPEHPTGVEMAEDYELVNDGGGGTRSARAVTPPVIIRSGFSADFINPKNLNVYGQDAEIVRDGNANIRQIKTDTGFLDVVSTPETKTVELRQYNPEDVGSSRVNGVYPIKVGKTPLVTLRYVQEADDTIRVDTIDNTSEFPSVKSERTKQTVGPKPYTITQQKTYLKGEGLSAVEYRRVSKTITGIPGGQPKEEKYLLTTEDMGTDGQWHLTERKTGRRAEYKKEDGLVTLYECDAANKDGTPVTPIATETSYTYYTDPMKPESFGKIRTLRRNDGYWENKYYDENANAGIEVEKTESPWMNTAAHEPGATPAGKIRIREEVRCSTDSGTESLTETVDGIAIAKEWTEKSPVNQQMVKEVRHQPNSGGDKVTTTVRYRRANDVPDHLTGKTVSIRHADGSMELYSYALNGQDLTITQDTGYGEGDSVSHGTRIVNIEDKDSGNLKEEVRYALEGGQAYWLGSKTGVNFDNKGVALKWVYDNNPEDYTEQRKDCCHVTWERGRDGIATTYTYDAAGRQTSATSRGITYTTEYKGLIATEWRQAAGSEKRYLVSEIQTNLVGRMISEKYPTVGGKTLISEYSFDSKTRTRTQTSPYGTVVSIVNTSNGQILSETGITGLTNTYSYTPTKQEGGGVILSVTDGNRRRNLTLDLLGNTVIDQFTPNIVTKHIYDAMGRTIKTVLPDGETKLYAYENETQIQGIDVNGDGLLNPSHDRLTKNERIFDPTWPEGKGSWKTTTSKAWQGSWKPVSIRWNTENGTLERSKIPGLEGYTLQENAPIAQMGTNYTNTVTLPDGQIQETIYTIQNDQIVSLERKLKEVSGKITVTEKNTVDVWGNVLSRTNTRTGTATYTYDTGTGALLSQTIPNYGTTSYLYGDLGRLTTTIFPDKKEQYALYNNEGKVLRQWGSQQYPVSYEYNAYGQKTEMTTYRVPVSETATWPEGAEGDKTVWTYDNANGTLLKKTYANGKEIVYTYTAGLKLKTETNTRGNITTYSYDMAGELVNMHFDDKDITPEKRCTYDQIGRVVSITTEGVVTYQYNYNDRDQIIKEQITIPTINGNFERDLVRSYDNYGRAIGYQLQQGNAIEQEITYSYTPAGQLAGVTADDKEFIYSYIPNAPQLVAQVTSPVHTVTNTYEANRDTLSSKTNRWKNKMDTPVISAYTYTMSSLGQRASVSTEGEAFGANPADWVWGYDALGQVASANEDRYGYDQIGNRRTSRKASDAEMIYQANMLNQYAQIGSSAPTYDADGNLLSGLTPTTSFPDRDTLLFAYNTETSLVSVSRNGKVLETYSYDHHGRRIWKGDSITLYDGYNAIAEYKSNTRTLKTTYAWGNDLSGITQGAGGVGGLLSVTEHDRQLPLTSYPCYDGNGNITEYLTEENAGTLTAHYEYDAFGQVVSKTGNREYIYQFSTKPYNELTGFIYFNYRNYDSVMGRWLERDPIYENGGYNVYSYLNNSSLGKIDILGLKDCKAPEVKDDAGRCCCKDKMQNIYKHAVLPMTKGHFVGHEFIECPGTNGEPPMVRGKYPKKNCNNIHGKGEIRDDQSLLDEYKNLNKLESKRYRACPETVDAVREEMERDQKRGEKGKLKYDVAADSCTHWTNDILTEAGFPHEVSPSIIRVPGSSVPAGTPPSTPDFPKNNDRDVKINILTIRF